jgi:hypothetical protein
MLLRNIYVLLGCFASLACCCGISGADESRQGNSYLIPMKVQQAFDRLAIFKQSSEVTFPPISDVKSLDDKGQLTYFFWTTDRSNFSIDANTGDVAVTYDKRRKQEVTKPEVEWLSEEAAVEKAKIAVTKFYLRPQILNTINVRTNGYTSFINFTEISPSGAQTLNRCQVAYRRDTGEVVDYIMDRCRETTVSTEPTYSREQAVAIARWSITQGKESKYDLPLVTEFTEEQKAKAGESVFAAEPRELVVLEDPWLQQRLVWKLQFNAADMWIDAHTGEILNNEATPIGEAIEYFKLPAPKVWPRPTFLKDREIADDEVEAEVNFGGTKLTSPYSNLFYPPLVRDGAALVYAEYFPRFLIDLEREGGTIRLRGKMKDKGKTASLQIYDKKAVIDGQETVLSSGPTLIAGRLYLPAELLRLVNGIPIRWQPKEKILSVETRYMRRD